MFENIKRFFLQRPSRTAMRAAWWLGLILLAAAGVWLIWIATSRGAGISPDSTVYISMAREMLLPFGFRFVIGGRGDFPPLYPALLAAGGALSGDPEIAARWINALLFGGNIILVGWMLHQILPDHFGAPLFGAGMMLTSIPMLSLHAMAWSEPTFLFCGLSGLLALASYIERLQVWRLVLAAAAVGLAAMDRYVGLALAATGIAALILFTPGGRGRQLSSAVLFAAITLLPLSTWLTHQPTRRLLTFQLPALEYFLTGFNTLGRWVVSSLPVLSPARVVLSVGVAVLVVLSTMYALPPNTESFSRRGARARLPRLLWMVTLFVCSYLVLHLLARTFFGPSLVLHERALSPVFVGGLVIFVSAAALVFSQIGHRAWLRLAFAALALLVLWHNLDQGLRYVDRVRVQGLGYSSQVWQDSPTIAHVRELPPEVSIYSNGSDAIYFLAARPAFRLPDKVDGMNRIANSAYLDQIRAIGERLKAGRAVIVYFNGFPDRWFQPTEQDLTSELPLHLIAREADGAIFQ